MNTLDLEKSLDKMKRIGELSILMDTKIWISRKKDELDYKEVNEYDFCKQEGRLSAFQELEQYINDKITSLKKENVTENKESITQS